MEAVIDATGLTQSDLMQQLMGGSTLSEIVTANGGDMQAIIDTAIASATERINQAVANGRLTQEQADERLANLEQNLTELMNGDLFARGAGIQAARGVLHLVVEQTGLSGQEVREQLQAGATLADILTTSGVDVSAFITDASARVEARLNVLVVDGRMTQERADELLAQFQTELSERITEPGFGIHMPEGVGI
jgi:3-hydroxyacyl-CoA dehydrogenase